MGKRIYKTEQERIEGKRRTQREADRRYREKMNKSFIVYKHTNNIGDVYIGVGNFRRPYEFNGHNRTKQWHEAFNGNPTVTILGEFKNKEIALAYESYLIAQEGVKNLLNHRLPVFKLTFPQR